MADKGFRDWLQSQLDERNIKPAELHRISKVSKQYISKILNATPHSESGAPPRPSLEVVDALAQGLGVPIDEARRAAGYASAPKQPRTVGELVRDLQEMGVVDQIHFNEADLADLPPEELDLIKTSIQIVIELSLRRARKESL